MLDPGEGELRHRICFGTFSPQTIPCVSVGCKPPWFSKLDVLAACLSGVGLKRWGTWCGLQMLCSLGVFSSLPIVCHAQHVGFWWDHLSLSSLLRCGFLLVSPMCRCCLAHLFWSRGNCPICSCGFEVSMEIAVQGSPKLPSWTRTPCWISNFDCSKCLRSGFKCLKCVSDRYNVLVILPNCRVLKIKWV